MQLPSILPRELSFYASQETEEGLFQSLSAKPLDLILFVIHACEDETWAEDHEVFMHSALEWLTFRSVEGRLSLETSQRLSEAIQPHFFTLKAFLPFNVTIQLKKNSTAVNSLMFAASTDFFRDLFLSHYKDNSEITVPLEGVPFSYFKRIENFINTGEIDDIWKYDETELFKLLRYALRINLLSLAHICENALKRYINASNVLEYLEKALDQSLSLLKLHCEQFINEQPWSVRIKVEFEEVDRQIRNPLSFEFLDFSDKALDVFSQLKQAITHLTCSGSLTEEAAFSTVIRACPNLICLDISHSRTFSDWLVDLPHDLQELDISRCPWLTNANIKKIFSTCPQLRSVSLASDVQLTFIGWAELQKLLDLRALNISRCHQIHNDDFSLILRACSRVSHLELEECRHLTDKAFFEMAKTLPFLAILNLSRTQINDISLLEIADRCSQLRVLHLRRCKELTERGLLQLAKQASKLEYLDLRNCFISEDLIKQLKALKPRLHCIYN